MSISDYTITQLETMLHKKELSATDVVDMTFKRIEEVDEKVGAFITTCEDEARQKAKQLDESGNTSSKLFAIPAGIKDNIVTKSIRTTAASKMLEHFNDPLYDATVIEKLNNEQSLMIGKLNMDEFAMGSTNETSAMKETRNPWNLDHVPGGSSGGSAAAVAAGEVLFSLGSDTGGSIRQPSSFCGVVGMKPTYGLVSRYGLIAYAPSLDQIGPITKNVEDNARVLEVIAGHDNYDSTSSKADIPLYTSTLKADIKGLKIAVPKEFLGVGVSEDVKEAIMNALQMYELLGASWEKVSLPHLNYADAVYYLIAMAEGSSSLARYDGVRFGHRAESAEDMIDMFKQSRAEGFGEEVKRRILIGSTVLSSGYNEKYYRKAQKVRTLIKNDFDAAFEKYDVILGPTTPTEAFKLGEKIQDPLTMYTSDLLNVPVNLAGLPAISVPCGFSENGLPLGLQIIGKHFDESTVYRAAYAYEQATNHHKKRPELGGTE